MSLCTGVAYVWVCSVYTCEKHTRFSTSSPGPGRARHTLGTWWTQLRKRKSQAHLKPVTAVSQLSENQ